MHSNNEEPPPPPLPVAGRRIEPIARAVSVSGDPIVPSQQSQTTTGTISGSCETSSIALSIPGNETSQNSQNEDNTSNNLLVSDYEGGNDEEMGVVADGEEHRPGLTRRSPSVVSAVPLVDDEAAALPVPAPSASQATTDEQEEAGAIADGEVSQDEGDDEDDESEYEYEDEDDQHFGGFLAIEQPSTTTAAATTTAATSADQPARIEEAPADEDGGDNPQQEEAAASITAAASTTTTLSEQQQPKKSKWREPSKAAVSMSLRAEREKTGGRRRLASDLYKIMMADTNEAGFSLEPASEDNMDKWKIKLFGFDEDSNLYEDMLILGINHIELEMSFPDQYPFEPPFVRVVRPRFKRQTGFVMNGALCMELLTSDGWSPINDIESVIVSIRSLLVVGDGRLQSVVEMTDQQRKAALHEAKEKLKEEDEGQASSAKNKGSDEDDDDNDQPPKKRQRCDVQNDGNGNNNDDETDATSKKKSSSSSSSTSSSNSNKKSSAGSYTASEAKAAYSHLSDYHKKKGWDTSGWWALKG